MPDNDIERLWVRTPADTWIPVPVGKGEDPTLASLNVYDGKTKKWHTPDWVFKTQEFVAHYPLRVRNTNHVYDDTYGENTNYDLNGNEAVITPAGWITLFHTQTRPDPTWRIINILGSFPKFSPSTKLGPGDIIEFSQRGGRLTDGYTLYYDNTTPQPQTPYLYCFGGGVQPVDTFDAQALAGARYINYQRPDNPAPATQYRQMFSVQSSGLIDLIAIHTQMLDKFEWRLPDYTGQYDSLLLNQITRVYLFGSVEMTIRYGSTDDNVADIDLDSSFKGITFSLYATTNYPAQDFPASYQLGYNPRHPNDTLAAGTRVVHQTGLVGQSAPTTTPSKGRSVTYTRQIELNFIAPTQDNIRFAASINNVPDTGFTTSQRFDPLTNTYSPTPYPHYIDATMQFIPQTIEIHYALVGQDTPADRHRPDSGLGDETG